MVSEKSGARNRRRRVTRSCGLWELPFLDSNQNLTAPKAGVLPLHQRARKVRKLASRLHLAKLATAGSTAAGRYSLTEFGPDLPGRVVAIALIPIYREQRRT